MFKVNNILINNGLSYLIKILQMVSQSFCMFFLTIICEPQQGSESLEGVNQLTSHIRQTLVMALSFVEKVNYPDILYPIS